MKLNVSDLNIDDNYLGQPIAVQDELEQPARIHMVTPNISLDDVKRAAYMASVAYEGYDMPLNAKVHQMGEKSQELLKDSRSKIHFFGQNGQKDRAVIEDIDGKIYISYRGTIGTAEDWINNGQASKRASKYAPDLKDKNGNTVYFHNGFLNRFESTFIEVNSILSKIAYIRGQNVKDLALIITGHSKGASISQDASLLLKILLKIENIRNITFAAARSMNHAGANLYNEQLDPADTVAVMQSYDGVTAAPMGTIGNKHASENRLFVPRMSMMHTLGDYIEGLIFMNVLLDNNLVLKDDMGNIYTGKGDKGRGNPFLRRLKNVGVRIKNAVTRQKGYINYTAMPEGYGPLNITRDMSEIQKELMSNYNFLNFSATPHDQATLIVTSYKDTMTLNSARNPVSYTKVTSKQLKPTVKIMAPSESETKKKVELVQPSSGAKKEGWGSWLKRKIRG